MVLGPKDVTTIEGKRGASTGDIFESTFDFESRLKLTGRTAPDNPTIILNLGVMAIKTAKVICTRPGLQSIQYWRIWQQNDKEEDRSTFVFMMS